MTIKADKLALLFLCNRDLLNVFLGILSSAFVALFDASLFTYSSLLKMIGILGMIGCIIGILAICNEFQLNQRVAYNKVAFDKVNTTAFFNFKKGNRDNYREKWKRMQDKRPNTLFFILGKVIYSYKKNISCQLRVNLFGMVLFLLLIISGAFLSHRKEPTTPFAASVPCSQVDSVAAPYRNCIPLFSFEREDFTPSETLAAPQKADAPHATGG